MPTGSGDGGQVLVGRDAELGLLQSVIGRAANGDFGALLVFGEAGIGKTALVHSAVDAAARIVSG
jgi:predicted ATPase